MAATVQVHGYQHILHLGCKVFQLLVSTEVGDLGLVCVCMCVCELKVSQLPTVPLSPQEVEIMLPTATSQEVRWDLL